MKRAMAVLILMSISFGMFAGCGSNYGLSASNPVTVNMWHNYGGDMQQVMDELIDEFNSTVGRDEGIVINVTAISSSSELNDSLAMILNDDPMAPDMPDIFTGYPKIAVQFYEKGMLANLDNYFSEKEISEYVSEFVNEGRLNDGGLYVFPIAKSTEILYLNQTIFDEFSQATGVDEAELESFEGICRLSKAYYEWTDGLTPDIAGDGKQFYAADSWFNVAQVGMKQLGGEFVNSNCELVLDDAKYKKIFTVLYDVSVNGGIAIYNGYSSDLSKTGDLVCSTGSSAGILFYGDTVTYTDGTVKDVEYSIRPYPTFDGGEKTAIQRGGGLIVAKTDEKKEYAASLFIKWLTAAEQNMRFISKTGYMPVTKKAFEDEMDAHIASVEDARIKKMLTAVMTMYDEFDFFTAPNYSNFDTVSKDYDKEYKALLTEIRENASGESAEEAYNRFIGK